MRTFKSLLCLLGLLALLAGCMRQAHFESFFPPEETEIARRLLSQVAARDYEAVEAQLDPRIKDASIRSSLEQMGAAFTSGGAGKIQPVGTITTTAGDQTTYDLSFEHELSDGWRVSNVVLQRKDGALSVLGLHVTQTQQSLKAANRFTFQGKGLLHYVFFVFTVAVPLFILATLVLCIRTPMRKRKWLWLLFILLGFVQFSLNWTTGHYQVQPFSFVLLGAGFFKAGPYAPYIVNFAIPLGAILFLLRRHSLKAEKAVSLPDGEAEHGEAS